MKSMYSKRLGIMMVLITLVLATPPLTLKAYEVGPEFLISWPTFPYDNNAFLPSVAANWNNQEFLVVWHEKTEVGYRDIEGQRISIDGTRIGDRISISYGTYDRVQPCVDYDIHNNRYLVVWMYDAGGTGNSYEIWGRYVNADGSMSDPEFKIFSYPNRSFWTPKIAVNKFYPNQLVVWSALNTQTGQFADILGAFVSGNGNVQIIPLIATANSPHQVNITYCNYCAKFMAVWRHMTSAGNGDIYGAFLHQASGAVMDPPGIFVINDSTLDQNFPSVATDDNNLYVVVYQNTYSGSDRDIWPQTIDAQGNKIGLPFAVSITNDDETSPQVASFLNSGRALAVYEKKTATGKAIWATHWKIGQTDVKRMEVASYSFWENETPAAAVGYKFTGAVPIPEVPVVVYVGDSTGDPTEYRRIYGRMLVFEKVFLPLLLKN